MITELRHRLMVGCCICRRTTLATAELDLSERKYMFFEFGSDASGPSLWVYDFYSDDIYCPEHAPLPPTVATSTAPGTAAEQTAALLLRSYAPPELFIFEEVELGGGYHTLSACGGPERGWSEPYKKTGDAKYRGRVVKVPYPPEGERR